MGIYLHNMEMPNKKNGAVLIIYPDGKCAFEDGKTYRAVPVPPHRRLIDADALANSEDCKRKGCVYQEEIFRAPTIIPAEEGE